MIPIFRSWRVLPAEGARRFRLGPSSVHDALKGSSYASMASSFMPDGTFSRRDLKAKFQKLSEAGWLQKVWGWTLAQGFKIDEYGNYAGKFVLI